jgi:hypothetical protein
MIIAHKREYLPIIDERTAAKMRHIPYAICEYQNVSSKDAGDLKFAS